MGNFLPRGRRKNRTQRKDAKTVRFKLNPFYNSVRWRKTRLYVLGMEPLCRPCAKMGLTTAAAAVDHITPISQGGAELDISNLQPICEPCHRAKTAREGNNFKKNNS
jgi:5-methylcytosine-specific restriction endonuclease McrA